MDVPQQKYRRVIGCYEQPLTNLISQYPINEQDLPNHRNLKYLIQKQSISMNLPYDDDQYQSIFDDVKHHISSENIEERMFAIRLARSLPFYYRVKAIEELQNEIIKLVIVSSGSTAVTAPANTSSPKKGQKEKPPIIIKQNNFQFLYEILSDVVDLLLSVYQLTHFSQQIYFDVNQRILSILGRISKAQFQILVENGYASEQIQLLRNTFQSIRAIFLMFGPLKNKQQQQGDNSNKLVNRLLNYFSPNNSFKGGMISLTQNNNSQPNKFIPEKSYTNKLYHLILKSRQFQARIRSRFMYGLCCLCTYGEQPAQTLQLLIKQVFTITENANQCDVNLQCFNAIKALLQTKYLHFHTRNALIKKWTFLLIETSYKKEYLQYFITLLDQAASCKHECSLKVKFYIGMSFLQITKNIQQQFSRFIVYKLACRNIMQVSKVISCKGQTSMVILDIFKYSWFVDRVKQQNDLFRSQFLVSLLHSFFTIHQKCSKSQVTDLISLCHYLLDWKCSSKEDTHIPMIKFAFDMYLAFLKIASQVLGQQIQKIIQELIEKCNDAQNIYFLFKLKLISTIVSLEWYQKNRKFLSRVNFNFNYLNDQIRISIMPKNPKPIFDFAYSQSADGLVQSRKQIEFVKVIMNLLTNLLKSHQEMNQMIETIITDYHAFLNNLQMMPTANRDLIYCLQTGTADQYFSLSQRNFLLSLIDETDCKGNNYELNLDGNIMYSPYQDMSSEDEINIFGPMSPVRLTVKLHSHNSFSSIYLEIKKNNWVGTPKLKLIVSSGMEKKELAFESSIVEIKIDRAGSLHFQVWTADGNELLIGSGNLKIARRMQWRKVNYLSIIEGITRKSYFKSKLEDSNEVQCYLSYYYGEPVLIQILRNQNEVIFGVSNKEVWNDLQPSLSDIIQEFTDGSAIIFQ